jgi:hypothetical protein
MTSTKEKAEALSKRYQFPLGSRPKRNKKRIQILKKRRKRLQKLTPRGRGHKPFTFTEVRTAREELSNGKAPGLSGIGKPELEMGGTDMDILVMELANKVAITGEWPQSLKTGANCPISKDDTTTDTLKEDQTRPITLLEVLDKWLEKLFFNRIKPHIKYHETQAGYNLSCDHHTTVVSDFIHRNNATNKYVLAVFTDISKAFESVPLDELEEVIWTSNTPAPYK